MTKVIKCVYLQAVNMRTKMVSEFISIIFSNVKSYKLQGGVGMATWEVARYFKALLAT